MPLGLWVERTQVIVDFCYICYMMAMEDLVDIIITGWGLKSYLNLRHDVHFTDEEYRTRMRPDIRLLRTPHDPKFDAANFWSPAATQGISVAEGWKMKWHNMGNGGAQIRLPILLSGGHAYLCEAYVKSSDNADKRGLARFSVHAEQIRRGNFDICGRVP